MKKLSLFLALLVFFLPFSSLYAAIAVDNTSAGRNNSSNNFNVSHTVNSNTNGILLCGTFTASTDNLTAVTYAATPMTLVGKIQVSGDRWVYLHYLLTPATGANNVNVTTGTTNIISVTCASYTGVSQTSPFNATSTKALSSQTTYSHTLTTTGDTWTAFMVKDNLGGMAAGTAPTTIRSLDAAGDKSGIYDSNSTVAAGSNTLTVTNSTANFASIMVAMNPFVAPTQRAADDVILFGF